MEERKSHSEKKSTGHEEGTKKRKRSPNTLPLREAGALHPETSKAACCGRNRSSRTYCKNVPGFGTQHVGVGRCKRHGGCTANHNKKHRYESARFSSRVGQLFDEFRNDPQPHNMLNELALLRAITVDFVERHEFITMAITDWYQSWRTGDTTKKRPPQVPDLLLVRKIVSDIGSMIERMHRIEQKGLISIQAFKQAFEQIGVVLASEVDDPVLLGKIEARLMKISVPNAYKAGALQGDQHKTIEIDDSPVSPDVHLN